LLLTGMSEKNEHTSTEVVPLAISPFPYSDAEKTHRTHSSHLIEKHQGGSSV